jgi:hypothetical protein
MAQLSLIGALAVLLCGTLDAFAAPKKLLAIYVYAHEMTGQFIDANQAQITEYTDAIRKDFDGNNDRDGFRWTVVKSVDQADISVEVMSADYEDTGGTDTSVSKGIFGPPSSHTANTRGFVIHGIIHAGDYSGHVQSNGDGAYKGAHLRVFRHFVEVWIHANVAQLSKVIAARTAAPAAR